MYVATEMKRLRYCFVGLTLVGVCLMLYVYRYGTDGLNAEVFFRLPSKTSFFRSDHGYSEVNSSYFSFNLHHYYNLVMKGFVNSDEETDEEDELLENPELENRRCEWKTHSSPIPLELKHRQYARKKLVYDLCDSNGTLGFNGKWQTFDDIPNGELRNLLVDDRHGIIYCYVPKVACYDRSK
ncbi:hypothetical protein NFI96_012282 [Prochilodus magdalenae]|nr:hypothetical protein NFI96_012282 [Prochilodus magdalenae]